MSYSDAEIDAAVAALTEPGRMTLAQDLVTRAAPGLQRVLAGALADGGWHDTAQQAAVKDAVGNDDVQRRELAVRTLLAEEARLAMLVGVAAGFELARELELQESASGPEPGAPRPTNTEQED